jgi:hypothetical protein
MVIIPPMIPKAQNKLLGASEFALQVYTPTTIGLILVMVGFYGILKDTTDERLWQVLITVSAGGAIFLSAVAGFLSLILLRWQSD